MSKITKTVNKITKTRITHSKFELLCTMISLNEEYINRRKLAEQNKPDGHVVLSFADQKMSGSFPLRASDLKNIWIVQKHIQIKSSNAISARRLRIIDPKVMEIAYSTKNIHVKL